MKVLFFTYDFPYPLNSGGKNRAYHLLKYAGEGVEFFLFSFIRDDFDPHNREKLKEICVKKIQLFKRRKVRDLRTIAGALNPKASVFKNLYFYKKILDKIVQTITLEKIDIVHYESFYTAFYLSERLSKLGVKQIFGTENIEHNIYKDYARYIASPLLKPFFYLESFKIEHEEKSMFKRADLCVAVTGKEAEYITYSGAKSCSVVENGVDTKFFSFVPSKKKKGDTLLFVGNFSYFPNRDAILFFYNNVFQKLHHDLHFLIVGKHVRKLPIANDSRVERIEYIADIREAYKRADVMVSPVRIEGLGVVPNEHVLIAESPSEFKEKIELLLNDESLKTQLSESSRKLVEEKFDWRKIGKKLNTIWKDQLPPGRSRFSPPSR